MRGLVPTKVLGKFTCHGAPEKNVQVVILVRNIWGKQTAISTVRTGLNGLLLMSIPDATFKSKEVLLRIGHHCGDPTPGCQMIFTRPLPSKDRNNRRTSYRRYYQLGNTELGRVPFSQTKVCSNGPRRKMSLLNRRH
uniref:Transthyretin-like family protein n=1 Tax=Strongyloides papillosus TaxID=174720 RepID=A0A0N5C999_STREA